MLGRLTIEAESRISWVGVTFRSLELRLGAVVR